jgi:hypothetical protein
VAESHSASPLRTVDKVVRRRDAHSHVWVRGGVVYSGGNFGGFLGDRDGGVSVGRQVQEVQSYEVYTLTLVRKQFLAAKS